MFFIIAAILTLSCAIACCGWALVMIDTHVRAADYPLGYLWGIIPIIGILGCLYFIAIM